MTPARLALLACVLSACAADTEQGTDLTTGEYDLLLVPQYNFNLAPRLESYRSGFMQGHPSDTPDVRCSGTASLEMQDALTQALEDRDILHLEPRGCIDCWWWTITIAYDHTTRTFESDGADLGEVARLANGFMLDFQRTGACAPPGFEYP